MTSHKRASSVANDISVKVRLPDGRREPGISLWNISLGGVFIELHEPLTFGAEVVLEFSLPSEPRHLRCDGFVVWSTKSSPEKAPNMHGVGLRLTDISIGEMRLLADAIGRRLEG